LTGDLIGLLDHLKIDKAIFVGHDWGGFIVWQMPLRHIDRVAGRRRHQHAAHRSRWPTRSISCASVWASTCISSSSRIPRAVPTRFLAAGEQTLTPSCASRCRRSDTAPAEEVVAGVGASPRLNLAFPQMIAGYDAKHDRARRSCRRRKRSVCRHLHRVGLHRGINWYRNMSRNWERSAGLDHTVRVPSLMIMAENDHVLPAVFG